MQSRKFTLYPSDPLAQSRVVCENHYVDDLGKSRCGAIVDTATPVDESKMMKTRLKKDPRDVPNYSVAEASSFLQIPASTIRTWAHGRVLRDGRKTQFLFRLAQKEPSTLSFLNLVEVFVLKGMRIEHGLALKKVRTALRYVAGELDIKRPLIEESFSTNGVDLFVERFHKLLNASQYGQVEIREALTGTLARIERDPQGIPIRLSPWMQTPNEPERFEIDPRRAFGQLVLLKTRVPVQVLVERFNGGDSVDFIAEDYQVEPVIVESAIRWARPNVA
ncbi:DUF433 domain-containing protein [Myxococcota bacterium]|nr:DUF433 domain-containing protein [Myxococcota bacterium]